MFRYPGGKNKLKEKIFNKLDKKYDKEIEYREPFFGGGVIGLNYNNNNIKTIWINDKDKGLAALWSSVINNKEELKDMSELIED